MENGTCAKIHVRRAAVGAFPVGLLLCCVAPILLKVGFDPLGFLKQTAAAPFTAGVAAIGLMFIVCILAAATTLTAMPLALRLVVRQHASFPSLAMSALRSYILLLGILSLGAITIAVPGGRYSAGDLLFVFWLWVYSSIPLTGVWAYAALVKWLCVPSAGAST